MSVALFLTLILACNKKREPVPDEAQTRSILTAHQWELTRLGSREIPAAGPDVPLDSPGHDLVPGQRPTIRFSSAPPGAGGRSFCNGYGSPYEIHGDSIRLTRIESSAVGCDGPDSLETRFFRALWATRRFEVDSTRLVLLADDGTMLTFARVQQGSQRDAFARTVDSLLLDTTEHELRAQILVVVHNPNRDDESPLAFEPLKQGAAPGHHTRDGRAYADIEVLRDLLGRELPVRLDTANHRFFVGSPEVIIYGHPHRSAWFVPVKLFARQYGAYVDVNCTLATCANIWEREMLEYARRTGTIGTAVLEAHAEGLIKIDVTRLPTG